MARLRALHPDLRRARLSAREQPAKAYALLDVVDEDGEIVATYDVPHAQAWRQLRVAPMPVVGAAGTEARSPHTGAGRE